MTPSKTDLSRKARYDHEVFGVNRVFLVAVLVGLFDLCLMLVIARRFPYTEIDWRAYMEQVEQALERGETDYKLIQGCTGPLVYPAGFVWFYYVLYRWTGAGTIRSRAQLLFAALHALGIALTCATFIIAAQDAMIGLQDAKESSSKRKTQRLQRSGLGWAVALAVAMSSRRVASIFVLRLFNDGVEAALAQASVLLFVIARWRSRHPWHRSWQRLFDAVACLTYSAAVSVKMNGLLYAPAVLALLWEAHGFRSALGYTIGICGLWQIVVGWRFLRMHPWSYLGKAFELGRVFELRWSVNFACLPEWVFVHRVLAVTLLALHVLALVMFACRAGVPEWLRRRQGHSKPSVAQVDAFRAAVLLSTCNLIGVAFARTLHYQFLAWVWWSLPFLALFDWMQQPGRLEPLADLAAISWRLIPVVFVEMVFNVYPPRCITSILLHAAHSLLLFRVWTGLGHWKHDVRKISPSTSEGTDPDPSQKTGGVSDTKPQRHAY
ncbi:hypothetical protein CCYA_CCYA10G2894 [Cyanidiococcus yangmingshanensis]|nr:hypothetical protein CCYA_CCYA10G2894 [Cyanidiococcus yangmingshanensis]